MSTALAASETAYMNHGAIIIVDVEEEHPPDPLLDSNAQFTDPLPKQLANMAAPPPWCNMAAPL